MGNTLSSGPPKACTRVEQQVMQVPNYGQALPYSLPEYNNVISCLVNTYIHLIESVHMVL